MLARAADGCKRMIDRPGYSPFTHPRETQSPSVIPIRTVWSESDGSAQNDLLASSGDSCAAIFKTGTRR